VNIGDTVTHINMVGIIRGVSSNGKPIVEWTAGPGEFEFDEEEPENLVLVVIEEKDAGTQEEN